MTPEARIAQSLASFHGTVAFAWMNEAEAITRDLDAAGFAIAPKRDPGDPLTNPIGLAYQRACDGLYQAIRAHGQDAGQKFMDLAAALENAFPDEVAAYKRAMGAID